MELIEGGNVVKDRLLTLRAAAEMLTISTGTLYNWRSKGILPKYKRYTESYIKSIAEKYSRNELLA